MIINEFAPYASGRRSIGASRDKPRARNRAVGGALAGALTLLALPASAATTTATFAVSATVQSTCSISASSLAFGAYTGAVITAPGSLTVTCSNSTPYNIGLNAGTGNGATHDHPEHDGPGRRHP